MDHKENSLDARQTLQHNFYVDDCLKPANNKNKLIHIAHNLEDLCAKEDFVLTMFVGNRRKLLESFPEEKLCKGMKGLDLCHDALPMKKALSVMTGFLPFADRNVPP